jgi:3-hydroxyisobutyrate dehydrogenase
MSAARPSVAVLGLGIMGSHMAARLAAAGFPLAVYNRNPAKAAALRAAGARVAASPAEAAAGAQFILSMLADDDAARAVWLGERGALEGAGAGSVLIESSTITVDWIRELAAAAQAKGLDLLDAPVTGSKVHAAAGELNFLVGGSAAALERARPVLAAMSKTITHLGPAGSGSRMKLINNFLCGVHVASLAEAVALIEKSGIDRTKAVEVLCNGAPGSPMVKMLSPRMTSRDYTPNFLLKLMAKDLRYAQREAGNNGLSLATAAAALGLFEQAVAKGHGERDMAAVVEPLRPDPAK